MRHLSLRHVNSVFVFWVVEQEAIQRKGFSDQELEHYEKRWEMKSTTRDRSVQMPSCALVSMVTCKLGFHVALARPVLLTQCIGFTGFYLNHSSGFLWACVWSPFWLSDTSEPNWANPNQSKQTNRTVKAIDSHSSPGLNLEISSRNDLEMEECSTLPGTLVKPRGFKMEPDDLVDIKAKTPDK